MRDSDWTRILGWPGYRVYWNEIDEQAKTLKLWVRRKAGNRRLVCSGCGRRVSELHEVYEREVRDLPCFEYRTTVAPFSKRFEEIVGQACESAAARQVARRFGARQRGAEGILTTQDFVPDRLVGSFRQALVSAESVGRTHMSQHDSQSAPNRPAAEPPTGERGNRINTAPN